MSGDPITRTQRATLRAVHRSDARQQRQQPRTHARRQRDMADAMNLLHAARAERQAAMAAGFAAGSPATKYAATVLRKRTLRHGRFLSDVRHGRFAPVAAGRRRMMQSMRASSCSTPSSIANCSATIAGYRPHGAAQEHRFSRDRRAWTTGIRSRPFYTQIDDRAFGSTDQFFLPLQTAQELGFDFHGRFACWGNGGDATAPATIAPGCSSGCSWTMRSKHVPIATFWPTTGAISKRTAAFHDR
jgi:putative ABC transport system permease protein